MNPHYRKEVDGLRAIAVFSVVFFHAGFSFFKGGFIGVDVFFVISGYLITNIILKEIIEKKFSIKNFYERRARRILPALFLVLFTTIPLAVIFLTRSELSSFFKSLVATSIFLSNIFFWKEAPYFNSGAELKPLLHTWSLSIEEQFYIFFPIALLLLWRIKKKLTIYFFIIIFIISLSTAEYSSKIFPNANFYFIFTRAWELAIGAIIAYYYIHRKNENIFSKKSREVFSFFGFIAILFSIFFYSEQSRFPGFQALVPTLGSAMILIFANKNTFIGKFLSNKFLVSIGLISYSFYLWHQPLFAFAKSYYVNIDIINKFYIIFFALILSFFSWKFVEKNFRDKKIITSKQIFFWGSISTFFFIIFGLSTNYYFDGKSRGGSEAELAKLLSKNIAVESTEMDERLFIKQRIIYESYKPEILIIGSSRIMQISNQISRNKILNLGVSGASIEDHITLTEMSLEKFDPETIIIGLDPWLFNKFNYQVRWKSLKKEYKKSLLKIEGKNQTTFNLSHNFENDPPKWESFLENIYKLINIKQSSLVPSTLSNNNKRIILRDGSLIYAQNEFHKLPAKLIDYSTERYVFSKDNYNVYDNFLKHLLNYHKKKVVIVLTPFHPSSYRLTIEKKNILLETEKMFIDLAKKNSIKVIGSFNPSKNNCKNEEFLNYIHPTKSCMSKVLRELY